MTEPRIQYAKTEDGVDIAFWTMGEGFPLAVASLERSVQFRPLTPCKQPV